MSSSLVSKIATRFSSLLFAIWAAINLLTLEKYPYAQCDEGYYGDTALTFLNTGYFGTQLLGDLEGFATNYVGMGRLYTALLALTFKVLGVSMWSARLLGYFNWLIIAFLVYAITHSVYGKKPALWATIFMAVSPSMLLRTRFARPEALLAILVLTQIWVYLKLRKTEKPQWAFLLGLLLIVAIDAHLNAIFFGTGIGLLILGTYLVKERSWRVLGWFTAGFLAGIAYFIPIHAYPDPQIAYQQFFGGINSFGVPRGFGEMLLDQLNWMWANFIVANRYLAVIEAIGLFIGVAIAVKRRTTLDIALVAVFGISMLLFTPQSSKAWYHATPWLPLIAILVGGAVAWLSQTFEQTNSQNGIILLNSVLAGTVFIFFLGSSWLVYSHRTYDYNAEITQIRALVDPDRTILMEASWWYGLSDLALVSDFQLFWYSRVYASQAQAAAEIPTILARQNIGTLVLDGRLHCSTNREPVIEALEDYAEQHCKLEGIIETPYIPWSSQSSVYTCSE